MKITNDLNDVILSAYNYAKEKNSEYITPEHLLYGMTHNKRFSYAIDKCGGDVESLRYNLATYIKVYVTTSFKNEPQESIEFQNVIMEADNQVKSSGKDVIDIDHILWAVYKLEDSYALYYLQQQDINLRDLIYNICHFDYDADEENTLRDIIEKSQTDDFIEQELEDSEKIKQAKKESDSFLIKYTTNLNKFVCSDEFKSLIGREDILDRTIQILCRKEKNNPIHIGEAGVGKTAITLGLAKRIVDDEVPLKLKGSTIYSLDIGSVIAGTKYRGDFEERIKNILNLIEKKENPIVYIDEIHNIVGAGALNGGSLDASNILKPYLISSKIKFIGATTFEEYKKFFEKDKGLTRRFQTIDIKEPTMEECIEILNGIKSKYESYHNVEYSDIAIKDAVSLSNKYINDRYLPDKAIDIIDEAGSYARIKNIDDEEKLVIDEDTIWEIISKMCSIPKQNVETKEADKLMKIEEKLKQRVFNQDNAIEEVVRCIKIARAGLSSEDRPVASMLFVGPTGVGKTEIAKSLSKLLGLKLIRFDMSEYGEKHSASKLIGSPPGYVGYDEGGLLTDAIRKTPYSILLLDEIEKAHEDILNVLLQVMDYATLTDNKGRKADFRNTIIIMTSNAGAKNIGKRIIGFGDKTIQGDAINDEVKKFFTPEFRNRLDKIVVFNKMNDEMANKIANKHLNEFKKKLLAKNINLKFDDECVNYIAKIGISEEFGAREIIRIISSKIKPLFIDEILFGRLKNGGNCTISLKNSEFFLEFL